MKDCSTRERQLLCAFLDLEKAYAFQLFGAGFGVGKMFFTVSLHQTQTKRHEKLMVIIIRKEASTV